MRIHKHRGKQAQNSLPQSQMSPSVKAATQEERKWRTGFRSKNTGQAQHWGSVDMLHWKAKEGAS